ncbi:MAG TPA: MFS transporter [Candidatus Binataceae bacterium]|nr:MFS transporter [Candidatus Binataceae bacterium]
MTEPAPENRPAPDSATLAREAELSERAILYAIGLMLFYQGFAISIVGIASPWIQTSFNLDSTGIARMFAWISVSSIGALVLSRMIDRFGRRRMILWCLGLIPICSVGAAVATNLAVFIAFQIGLCACVVAAGSGCIVMLSEELSIERRARGQGVGGLAGALGMGLCVMLMPVLEGFGLSWRWLLVISSLGIVLLPTFARLLPESTRWERSTLAGITARSRFYDVFQPLYRKRSITLIVCQLAAAIATTAAGSFAYYHAVSVAGLTAGTASLMTVLGGGLGLVGFPLGAWTSERFGRVPTVVGFGIAITVGHLWFFWGPPHNFSMPQWWLAIGFCLFSGCDNAGGVASSTAATELFPTALRGTMFGWFALVGAIGAVISNVAVALLANAMGGVSIVTGALSIVGIPAAILFGLMIDETRGMALEAAAQEEEFDASAR